MPGGTVIGSPDEMATALAAMGLPCDRVDTGNTGVLPHFTRELTAEEQSLFNKLELSSHGIRNNETGVYTPCHYWGSDPE